MKRTLLLIVVIMVAITSWADGVCTNTTTSVSYPDIQSAINAVAEKQTIQLTADINLTATIRTYDGKDDGTQPATPEFTLDLNGHTLDGKGIPETKQENKFGCLIYNEGKMTITNSNPSTFMYGILTGGKGYGSGNDNCGGAILNMGTMYIDNITITKNSITFVGGGIDNNGWLDIKNTTISNNSVSKIGGTTYGGGICNEYNGTLYMTDCFITNNSTDNGGGIYNTGIAEIKNTTIANNITTNGGGIYSINTYDSEGHYFDADITLSGCTIKDNTATSTGGGIYNTGIATVENTTISGNKTAVGGGICSIKNETYQSATITLSNNTIKDNSASTIGGGIYNNHTCKIENCTITDNLSNTYNAAGICHIASLDNASNMTLKGKNIIRDNKKEGSKDSVSNLVVTNLYYGGKNYNARITLNSLSNGSEIGIHAGRVTPYAMEGRIREYINVASPITVEGNGTKDDLQYFVVDNQDYYKAYNTTGSYLELKKAEFDAANVTQQDLDDINGQTVNLAFKNRTLFKDGENNTICLPFSLDKDELAESPLAGFSKLQKFSSASIVNKGQDNETLELTMEDATTIEAGTPYIIAWASDTDISDVKFTGVTVTTSDAGKSGTSNGVTFCGTFTPQRIEAGKGTMFVGKGGKLYWPGEGGNIKGFRCYFTVDLENHPELVRGMLAAFADGEEETGIMSAEEAETNVAKARKLIENGRVVIISNGVRYSLDGKRL